MSVAVGQSGLAHKAAAAVGELGPGRWALVSAGFDAGSGRGNEGWVYAYDIPTPRSIPWPMHRKNSRRLGADAFEALPITCDTGYRLVAADGGVFTFGDAAFHGSTGHSGSTSRSWGWRTTPWPTATGSWPGTGGSSPSGTPPSTAPPAGTTLNQPIVGMAAHPEGQGYWLVAADGGIFTFGGAPFLGSTGAMRLNSPIVGMASTPTGAGYWLVAADGGIFSFGDAPFLAPWAACP